MGLLLFLFRSSDLDLKSLTSFRMLIDVKLDTCGYIQVRRVCHNALKKGAGAPALQSLGLNYALMKQFFLQSVGRN